MSRRKPRFTPDPPPHGASNEQILAWVNAQLQRIEDYWPRDDGDRITALEELQSKYSGEWSITGQSSIRFEGAVTQGALGDDEFLYLIAEPNPNSGNTIQGESIDTDANDNFAVLATSSAQYGDSQALCVKFDINGNILWQKYLYKSVADIGSALGTRGDIRFDSAGDVVVAIPVLYDSSNQPQIRGLVAKLDGDDGSILWQKVFYESADNTSVTEFSCLDIDDDDYIYAGGRFEGRSTTLRDAMVVKLASDGTVQWQRGYWGTSTWDYNVNEISVVDGSCYLAVSPETIIKISASDGSVSWANRLDIYSDNLIGIDANSSGDVFVFTRSLTGGTSYYGTVTKYNSSGSRQWTQKASSPAIDYYCYSGSLDTDENAYLVGRMANGGEFRSVITAFDTDGNVEYDRYVEEDNLNGSIFFTETKLTVNGSVLAVGFYSDADQSLLVTKLPKLLPTTRNVGVLEHGDAAITASAQTPNVDSSLSITVRSSDLADVLTSEYAAVDGAFIEDLTYWDR